MPKKIIVFSLVVLIPLIIAIYLFSSKNFIKRTQPPPPTKSSLGAKSQVKYSQDKTIVLVGDSMTEILGNSDELRSYLSKYYPDKSFEFLNYGFGSTNILSVQERLEKATQHGREFRPITQIDFDLILIESFGHNPLSEFSLNDGLKKQTEALEKIVKTLKKTNPKAKIIFVATIAPNKKKYGQNQVNLSSEKRDEWADERIAYIKNHIKFAQTHSIPLINIYEKSLKNGDGNLDYISTTDFIHPSPKGVYFISQEIADFLYNSKILD